MLGPLLVLGELSAPTSRTPLAAPCASPCPERRGGGQWPASCDRSCESEAVQSSAPQLTVALLSLALLSLAWQSAGAAAGGAAPRNAEEAAPPPTLVPAS